MIRTCSHDSILQASQLPSTKNTTASKVNLPVIKPLSLFLGSLLSSTNAWKCSSPWTSVRLKANKKLRQRNPTAPTVALWMARVTAGGSYGRSSAAIEDSGLEKEIIDRRQIRRKGQM